MKQITKPNIIAEDLVKSCIDNVKYPMITDELIGSFDEYDDFAENGKLYTIKQHVYTKSGASKEFLEGLYTKKFVPSNMPGRIYYDSIKSITDICPYCGQAKVSSLDHYLPKSKYPKYSITSYNLVPVCADCNKNKLDDEFNKKSDEFIHPYYDKIFYNTIWISAKLVECDELAIIFYVNPPDDWNCEDKQKALHHFKKLHLDELYLVHAGEEIHPTVKRIIRTYIRCGIDEAKNELCEMIQDEQSTSFKKWKIAMYKAILDSEWFWDNYIKLQVDSCGKINSCENEIC